MPNVDIKTGKDQVVIQDSSNVIEILSSDNGVTLKGQSTGSDVVLQEGGEPVSLQGTQVEITSPVDQHVVLEGQGPQGPAGASSGSVYIHTQATASDTWTIPHNFGREPVAKVYITGYGWPVAVNGIQLNANTLQLCFKQPVAGRAVLV